MKATVRGVGVRGNNVQAWCDIEAGNMKTEDVVIGVEVREGDFIAEARDQLIRLVEDRINAVPVAAS